MPAAHSVLAACDINISNLILYRHQASKIILKSISKFFIIFTHMIYSIALCLGAPVGLLSCKYTLPNERIMNILAYSLRFMVAYVWYVYVLYLRWAIDIFSRMILSIYYKLYSFLHQCQPLVTKHSYNAWVKINQDAMRHFPCKSAFLIKNMHFLINWFENKLIEFILNLYMI